MQVISTIAGFRKARSQAQAQADLKTLGLVPTMGYLHEGHLALVRQAALENDAVAVSIFVNPSQFGQGEDFSSYPRDMERDLALLEAEGVALVFTPSPEEMYPPGFDTWVEVGEVAEPLEGAHRPGHFRGVATVVAKLFNIVRPHRAYFGQKDGQQVAVIKRMAADLDMGLDIVVVPTVREPDGLALSSRNVYLTTEQRQAAPVIYKALCQARRLWEEGERDGERLRRSVRHTLEQEPLIEEVHYVSAANSGSLHELDTIGQGQAVMVSVAVQMGRTRLIDNIILS
jgi:pantoate--beta-alanine ligase